MADSWPYVELVHPVGVTGAQLELADIYRRLRLDLYDAEHLAASPDLDAQDAKRLDKAIVVMKVGAKLLKKVLKSHGFTRLKPADPKLLTEAAPSELEPA